MVSESSEVGKSPKTGSGGGAQGGSVGSEIAASDQKSLSPDRGLRGAVGGPQRPGNGSGVATGSVGTIFSRVGDPQRFSRCRTGRFSAVPPVQEMGYNEPKSRIFDKNYQF